MVELSDSELRRYSRQLILPRWGPRAQLKLREAAVFVAGAGGLGSPVILYLAAAGVGRLRVCDGAEVELSNLNRQILYTESEVGQSKADLIAGIVTARNPRVRVEAVHALLTKDNVAGLVGKVDLILDCLDNFPSRLLLNEHAARFGIPLLHAGVRGWSGQVAFLHPPRTPCLACLLAANAPPSGDTPGAVPILGAAAGVVGSLQALEAVRYLSSGKSLLSGRILFWDGEHLNFHLSREQRNPLCPVCGRTRRKKT